MRGKLGFHLNKITGWKHWEEKCADTSYRVAGSLLAISSAKIHMYFSNKIYGSNFIKQYSETIWFREHPTAPCICCYTTLSNINVSKCSYIFKVWCDC